MDGKGKRKGLTVDVVVWENGEDFVFVPFEEGSF